jgi:hypothetical protein
MMYEAPPPCLPDEILDWDFFAGPDPERPSGTISVTLEYVGRLPMTDRNTILDQIEAEEIENCNSFCQGCTRDCPLAKPFPRRINYAPMLLWIGVCVAGITACGSAWIASAVLAWFIRTAPVWVLVGVEATVFLAGGAVALACLTPRK